MTATLDISEAQIATRFVGAEETAGPLDLRLRSLLKEQVLPAAADQLPLRSDEAVICIPTLPVHVQVTLDEVMSGQGYAALVAALLAAVEQARRVGALWEFPSQHAFLAAYLRTRLDLAAYPEEIFADLGTLDLLEPVQAMIELLRENPALWMHLAEGNDREAQRMVSRLVETTSGHFLQQLGELALSRSEVDGKSDIPQDHIGTVLASLVKQLSPAEISGIMQNYSARGIVSVLIFARLLGTPDRPIGPAAALSCALAAALAMHTELLQQQSLETAVIDLVAALPPSLRARAKNLALAELIAPEGRACFLALVKTMRAGQDVAMPAAATPSDQAKKPASAQEPQDAAPETTSSVLRLTSRAAGVAICLPFMTENRIGRDFPAKDRLEALLDLAGEEADVDPEDPALLLLAGEDSVRVSRPERPNRTDLLFVPQDAHPAIMDAAPGAARLATWTMARLAATLPGLAASSPAHLRRQFLHQPGVIHFSDESVLVEIDRMPLAVVLEMSGLLEGGRWRLDWLGGRSLTLRLREVAL